MAGPDTGDGGQSDGPRVECVYGRGRIGSKLLRNFIAKRKERHGLAGREKSLLSAWKLDTSALGLIVRGQCQR